MAVYTPEDFSLPALTGTQTLTIELAPTRSGKSVLVLVPGTRAASLTAAGANFAAAQLPSQALATYRVSLVPAALQPGSASRYAPSWRQVARLVALPEATWNGPVSVIPEERSFYVKKEGDEYAENRL